MPHLMAVAKFVLGVFALASVVQTLYRFRTVLHLIPEVWKRFTVRGFLASFAVVVLTAGVGWLLSFVPGLDRGWASLVFGGAGGNVLFEPISDLSRSGSLLVRLAVPLYFLAIIAILPLWAMVEEVAFRKGRNDWRSIARSSAWFGPLHCLCGIPPAFGLALILAGAFYGSVYKRAYERCLAEAPGGHVTEEIRSEAEYEAIFASTVAHTLYNLIPATLGLVYALARV